MKKSIKILYIILCVMIALAPILLATDKPSDMINLETNQPVVSGWGNTIVGIIKVVGVFVAIGALMAIGIKYMMGSAEEKAEYKKVMIPYIIGAVLLFAAAVFADKIAEFANNLFS